MNRGNTEPEKDDIAGLSEPPSNRKGSFPQEYITKGETAIYESRPKLLPYILKPIVLGIIYIIVFVIPVDMLLSPFKLFLYVLYAWTAFILILFVLLPILFALIRWLHTYYALTNKRIVMTKGLFSRSLVDIPISRVNSTLMLQPLFERIFGYGTLAFTSGGSGSAMSLKNLVKSGEVYWRAVKDPVLVRNFVNEATEAIQKEAKAAEFKEMAKAFKEDKNSP